MNPKTYKREVAATLFLALGAFFLAGIWVESAIQIAVTNKLTLMLTTLAASVGVLVTIFLAGVRSNKKNTEVKNLKGYVKAQERVNGVEVSADRDAAIKRLRDNNQLRD